MNDALVSVVIPTFNRKEQLARLIDSIFQSSYCNTEVIVVDDASTDGTSAFINSKFPTVKVIRHTEERLLAAARNSGIRAARGEYFFVIDDDNVVEKDAIKELLLFMERDTAVGVSAPLMLYLSDPEFIWCAGIKRNRLTSKTTYIHSGQRYDSSLMQGTIESEDFPNALMIRNSTVKKIGYFDEKDFPINYDEADFCMRARLAGYRVTTCLSARIWHDIPSPRLSDKNIGYRLRILNVKRTYFLSYNRALFHKKYNTKAELVAFTIFLPLFILHSAFTILRTSAPRNLKIEALKANFAGACHALIHKTPHV